MTMYTSYDNLYYVPMPIGKTVQTVRFFFLQSYYMTEPTSTFQQTCDSTLGQWIMIYFICFFIDYYSLSLIKLLFIKL